MSFRLFIVHVLFSFLSVLRYIFLPNPSQSSSISIAITFYEATRCVWPFKHDILITSSMLSPSLFFNALHLFINELWSYTPVMQSNAGWSCEKCSASIDGGRIYRSRTAFLVIISKFSYTNFHLSALPVYNIQQVLRFCV